MLKHCLSKEVEIVEIDDLDLETNDSIKKPLVDELSDYRHFGHLVENYDFFKESFKTIDLNNDGKLDIFYSGYLGGASDSYSCIFINEDGMFDLVFEGEIGSRFLYAIKNKNNTIDLVYFYLGPFAPIPQLMRLDLIKVENGIENITTVANFMTDIESPNEFFKEPISFKVLNPKYYLRSSPRIENQDIGYGYKGNIVKEYSQGTKGIAFAKEVDETGRIWWFVFLDDKYSGWMSSRFLEEL